MPLAAGNAAAAHDDVSELRPLPHPVAAAGGGEIDKVRDMPRRDTDRRPARRSSSSSRGSRAASAAAAACSVTVQPRASGASALGSRPQESFDLRHIVSVFEARAQGLYQ